MKRTKLTDTEFFEQQVRELKLAVEDMKAQIEWFEGMIEDAQPIVKVAYLSPEAWDYIDKTETGLKVGDLVNAPTRYRSRNAAVVVQVGAPRSYQGKLTAITEITSR